MENIGLQIALEESGGFSWSESSGWDRIGITAAKQFMCKKIKGNFGWEIFGDFIGDKARG